MREPNRPPSTNQPTNRPPADCNANPSFLAGYAPSSASLKWDGCLTASTMLVWYGQRCGANGRSIQWTGVYAADKSTNKAVPNCHTSTSSSNYAPGTALGAAVFGTCGVAPSKASR
jgi:hypothetical protein